MITAAIFPGRYIQGPGAIVRLQKLIPRFGTKGLLIVSPSGYDTIYPEIRSALEGSVSVVAEKFGRECCDEEIARLKEAAGSNACDIIVGIGGGKTIDTAKVVAHELNVPVIIVPTIASTDAPCTGLAVIYRQETGTIKRVVFPRRNPDVVLVDTQIIADSPVRFLVAGMGDALATWFEAESCMRKYAKTMTRERGTLTAYTLSHLCYMTLLEYGVAAKRACKANVVTPALEHVVEATTLLSGIGAESGGLGAAHALHDGLNALDATHAYYHGEKVAFGLLASLFLTGKPKGTIDEVYSFCESVGLPTTLAGLGLADASDAMLMKAATIASGEKQTIHNERVPISPAAVLAALRAADIEGISRRDG